jgi:hypothetical protein
MGAQRTIAYDSGPYPYPGDLPFCAYVDEFGDARALGLRFAPPPPYWWRAPTLRFVAHRTADITMRLVQVEFAYTTELSDDGISVPICR